MDQGYSSMYNKPKILFLCTGNACRSQMAEGLCRHLRGETLEPYSAGIEVHGLDPLAVEAMAEIGIDISAQRSKSVSELKGMTFEYVVTVCDSARESCPFFPAETALLHRGFPDPPRLAAAEATDEAKLNHYRDVRDEIKTFILTLPDVFAEKAF
jgi:arsenate reductase